MVATCNAGDVACRGPGDLFGGIKQSGKMLSTLCAQQLLKQPALVEHARSAAAATLSTEGGLSPRLKAALLAYGFWELHDGEQQPVSKDGLSGV